MKKTLLAIILLATLISGCKTSNSVNGFLKQHNFKESHVVNPATGEVKLHASIDSLYDYSKVAELCDTADVTFHISRGSVIVDANCTGAGESLVEIFKKLFARVKF